ncbi:hypothetical protein N0V82_009003 [Gnomoniopsis sp. IMI 355080]|nr:hypothetical protein N0V82_009003 [Gnomoniopsis sp. IMI 355080]
MDNPTCTQGSETGGTQCTRRPRVRLTFNRMVRVPTAARFGLRRCPQHSLAGRSYRYGFLQSWLDPEQVLSTAQEFRMEPIDHTNGNADGLIFIYAMSVATRSFVVHGAFLSNGDTGTRLTEMRAWQLIADSWMTGGGTQPPGEKDGLQYLVFRDVVQTQTCLAMVSELQHQSCQDTVDGQWATAEFTPASSNWQIAPFIRCSERVADALSIATREIKATRAWVVYKNVEVGEADFHLVVELGPVINNAVEPSRI